MTERRTDAANDESPDERTTRRAISRRGALKVLAASATLGGAAGAQACGSDPISDHERLSGFRPLPAGNPRAAGTATDPDLLAPVVPWDSVLGEDELALVADLADLILPADARSPAASALGVHRYIDEFVSAPEHEERLATLRGGLAWLNRVAAERHGAAGFAELDHASKREICDEIRHEASAPTALRAQARFFDEFRDMAATGYWTTEEGMRDLGYVGNVPLPRFDGPPAGVLERLGLSGDDLA